MNQPHNGIQGRSYFMRHGRKEFGFRRYAQLRLRRRVAEGIRKA